MSDAMKARIEAVLSHTKREHIQLEVDSGASVREVKAQACKQLGLVSEDHQLEVVLFVPIPGSFGSAQDPATGKWKRTDKKLPLRLPRPLEENEALSELGIPESVELLLVRKLDAIRRCPVCRCEMKLFCIGLHFNSFSEVLVCPACNRVDRVLIGEDHDFSREYSATVLWQTDDLLIVGLRDELVKVYELYGEAHTSGVAEARIRYHRETTFANPRLEKVQGTFRDRMVEALRCDPETRNLDDRALALRILGDTPDNPEAWAEIIKADLQNKCGRLPGPGNSAKDFLRNLDESLEALNALGASLNEVEKSRLRGYVSQLRNPDGGWTREIELKEDPDGEVKLSIGNYRGVLCTESHVDPTYWAVAALNALSVDLEERTRTVEFLQGRQFRNGGFNEGRSSTPRAFLSSTSHAVETLHMLGAKPRHPEDCVSWVRHHQELNPLLRVFGRPYGGFASGEHEQAWSASIRMEKPSLLCTHEAVKALSSLGSSPRKPDQCVRYVLGEQTRFGFGRGWSFDTLCALSALETLDSVREIDRLP
jgi:hypothetical protein